MFPPIANAGTPLMWLTMGQLAFGNVVIGLVEAAVIWWWTRKISARLLWAVPINYLSAFLGLFAIQALTAILKPLILGDEPLLHLNAYLAAMLFGTFLFTVVIEWPLYARALKPWLPWQRTFLPVLAAQIISYALLVAYYVGAISLPSDSHIQPVQLAAIVQPAPATIYFISPDEQAICTIRSDGTGQQVMTPIAPNQHYPHLDLEPESDKGHFQLVLKTEENPRQIAAGFTLPTLPPPELLGDFLAPTLDWRPEPRRSPEITAGFWAADGLRIGRWGEPRFYRIAVETPFTWWQPGPATVLPSGQVIYQLDEWLMLFDPSTRQIATITRGRSPVAIPDPPTATSQPTTP